MGNLLKTKKVFLKKHLFFIGSLNLSLIAFLATLAITPILGNSSVTIGLDTDIRFQTPPIIEWSDDKTHRKAFEQISLEFSPTQPFVELKIQKAKNPSSQGHEIFIGRLPKSKKTKKQLNLSDPNKYLWDQINDVKNSNTFLWKSSPETPSLIFLKTPKSGIVHLKSATGEHVIDLYSPIEEVFTLVKTDISAARYYVTVPRRSLGNLRLVFPENTEFTVHRIYVGTFIPKLFFTGDEAYPKYSKTINIATSQTNWTPTANNGVVSIPPLAPTEQGGLITFLSLFALFLFLLVSIVLSLFLSIKLFRILRSYAKKPDPAISPFQKKTFFFFFVLFSLVFLFYLSCAYPGRMSFDSVEQWELSHSWEFVDDHPVFHTLTIKFLSAFWDSPAVVAITQVVTMSFALAYGFGLLLRIGVPRLAVFPMFFIALLSPKNAILGITLWKDIPFSISILMISVLLLRMCFQRNVKFNAFYWIAIGILMGTLPLFRHNGLLILVILAPILPLFYWRSRKNVFLFATVLSLVLFTTIKFGLYPALDIKKWEDLPLYIYSPKISFLIDQDVPFSQDEYDFLNAVRKITDDRWDYNPSTPNTAYSKILDVRFAIDNIKVYQQLYFRLGRRYPLYFVQDHLERTNYIYALSHPKDIIKHRYHYIKRMENRDNIVKMGYPTKSFFPKISKKIGDLIARIQKGNCILIRPALALHLVMVSLIILLLRTRHWQYMAVFLPALLCTLSVLIVPMGACIRYQFPLTLTMGFLVCLAFIRGEHDDNKLEC